MTGLQLIHETLKRKERQDSAPGEFVRLLTGNEVIAGHLPFESHQARGGIYRALPEKLPSGTIFHTCIEISDEKIKLPNAFTPVSEYKLAQIRASIIDNNKIPKLDLFTVDQRYLRAKKDNYDAHRRPTDVLNHKKTGLSNGDGISKHSTSELNSLFIKKDIKHLVWLPPDSVTKRDIKAWVDFSIHSSLTSITIADIPLHRARIFEYIVSTEEVNSFSRKNSFYIYIITRNWSVAAYKSKVSGNHFIFVLEPRETVNRLGLDKLNCMLRDNDSRIFWSNVLTPKNSSFVNEPVIWDKSSIENYSKGDATSEIQGYLDFSESISNSINFKIIKAALERTIALWREQKILILGIDDLVKPFSGDINIIHDLNYFYKDNDNILFDKILLVGSTLVTGKTSDRIKSLIFGNHPNIVIEEIYVLLHPSCNNENTQNLKILDWAKNISIKKPRGKKYERLEGTPYIKRGGTKSYRIDRSENPSSPYNMYRDFTQGHLKLGHWQYDTSHDLLTPNLSRVISTNPEIVNWYCKSINNLFSDKCINDKRVKNFLVYISHTVTNKLIDLLKNNDPNIGQLYEIHSLQKLNIGASQHVFFSPIVLEKIEKYSLKKIALNIILIDDGVISGVTLRNAEASLLFSEEDRLTTLSILDRNGFVSSDNVKKSMRRSRKTYWSWDVPSLGKLGHCLLCHSIEAINSLARTNANNWINIWTLKKVTDQGWNVAGIPPQRLSSPYPMKFGEPSETITHTTSTTLSSMSIEISNSSFQPDFSLYKFYLETNEKISLSPNISLEILTTHMFS